MLLMVSGRSLKSEKENSSRILKKFIPDPDPGSRFLCFQEEVFKVKKKTNLGPKKNSSRIPDLGGKKAPDPGSRIPDPQHWTPVITLLLMRRIKILCARQPAFILARTVQSSAGFLKSSCSLASIKIYV
jgi:hypothetical protein